MNWSDGYYRQQLSGDQQRIYDAILDAWSSGRTTVQLPAGVSPGTEMNPIVECVAYDHPEIFWVDYYAYSIRRAFGLMRGADTTLLFTNFYAPEEIRSLQQQVLSWRDRILSQVNRRLPVKGQVWMLYDYLARQVTYGNKGHAQSHTLLGCMLPRNHIAVCEGIAKGFKFLCDAAGLPCIFVSGDVPLQDGHGTERHAWNLVEVDGAFRHLDVTAELDNAHHHGRADQMNFLMTDQEMRQQGYCWDGSLILQCR